MTKQQQEKIKRLIRNLIKKLKLEFEVKMTELNTLKGIKTLKDIEEEMHKEENEENMQHIAWTQMFLDNKIRSVTIKWVKEDIKDTPTRNKDAWALIFRWMKRLNITEEDMK